METEFNTKQTKETKFRFSPSSLSGGAVALFLLVLIAASFVPNYMRSGTSKTSGIIWRLRMLDAAKQEWAMDHHETNDVTPTKEDLAVYLARLASNDPAKPVAGEIYRINSLYDSPEAELTRELEGRPAGTLFRLGNGPDIIILPKQSAQVTP